MAWKWETKTKKEAWNGRNKKIDKLWEQKQLYHYQKGARNQWKKSKINCWEALGDELKEEIVCTAAGAKEYNEYFGI